MTTAERRTTASVAPERLNVVANSVLLTRRIRDLQRRRHSLVARQEQLRLQLPDWAVEPLRLVGMTSSEIKSLVSDWSSAETEAGLDDIEHEIDEIDRQIDDLEKLLVGTPSGSLEEIESVVSLTIARFHEIIVTDPNDVFYDHREARLLALIERVHEDICGLLRRSRLEVG